MTSAIKISDALCMKEYNQKIGCSGGINNVVADITAINKTKYTLSVVTVDGVITATARGPNDAAAIAAATAAAGLPPAPTLVSNCSITRGDAQNATYCTAALYVDLNVGSWVCPVVPAGFSGLGSGPARAGEPSLPTAWWGPITCITRKWSSTPIPAPLPTPPSSSLNGETYILNPTIDVTGKITYIVGGTCIAAGLCQAN